MQNQTDDTTEELADKHDGVEIGREHIQASFEYEVTLTADQLASMPDDVDVEEFAANLATSRFETEVDPTFSTNPRDAFVKEQDDYFSDGQTFTVLVRHDANDS